LPAHGAAAPAPRWARRDGSGGGAGPPGADSPGVGGRPAAGRPVPCRRRRARWGARGRSGRGFSPVLSLSDV